MKKRTKRNIKTAYKTWLRMLIAGIMCAVITLSLSALAIGLLGKEVGYRIVKDEGNQQTSLVEEVYYEGGEKPEGELTFDLPEGQYAQAITKLTPGAEFALNLVTLLCCLFLLGVFPYNLLWEMGSKDENKIRFGHGRYDAFRGAKIGAMANIPTALLYVLLFASRFGLLPEGYFSVYRIANIPFLSYINWVAGTEAAALRVGELVALAAPLLFMPLVCFVAYRMGYRQFSLKEHLTYQKAGKETEGEI